MRTFIPAISKFPSSGPVANVHVYVLLCVYVHVRVHGFVCVYLYVCVCARSCAPVCVHVCVCVCYICVELAHTVYGISIYRIYAVYDRIYTV